MTLERHPPPSQLAPGIAAAAALVQQADFLLIAAGAGMGVDSGLPDFRGQEGFWRAYPALRQGRLDFSSVASPSAFRSQPRLAWGFYGHRLKLYRNTVPNPTFSILKGWGEHMENGYGVFTSNVDGQFQLAGFPDSAIEECHGSIHRLQCINACTTNTWPATSFHPDTDDARCLLAGALPLCPQCGAIARPNILIFGDSEWIPDVTEHQHTRLSKSVGKARRPLVVEIGAGTSIPSVRHFSESVARYRGGSLIRINVREPNVSGSRDIGLAATGMDAVLAINAALTGAVR